MSLDQIEGNLGLRRGFSGGQVSFGIGVGLVTIIYLLANFGASKLLNRSAILHISKFETSKEAAILVVFLCSQCTIYNETPEFIWISEILDGRDRQSDLKTCSS